MHNSTEKTSLLSRTQIRRMVRQKRNELSINDQQTAAVELSIKLQTLPYIQTAKKIALYLANDGELNPMLFIKWCWREGKEVYLPVIHPFNKHNLLFLRYGEETQLQNNKFGILEPVLDVTTVCPAYMLDVLCTPLVAFDANGARLGMGGGFYDRTLANWYSQQSKLTSLTLNEPKITNIKSSMLYPIGIAHNCQLIDAVPIEHWDIPLPEIITPNKRYLF